MYNSIGNKQNVFRYIPKKKKMKRQKLGIIEWVEQIHFKSW